MKREAVLRRISLFLVLLFVALVISACSETADPRPRIWIDFPRRSRTIEVGLPVEISFHAYAPEGLAEVVFSVNGEAYQRLSPQEDGAEFSEFTQEWTAVEEGKYLIKLVAYDQQGEISNPAAVSINVVGQQEEVAEVPAADEPTLTPTIPTVTPVDITITPVTVVPEPEPVCPPVVTTNTDANCREGPGQAYDLLTTLSEGTSATVVGRSNDSSYWVIERPDAAGNCWIWDQLVSLSTDTCKVMVFDTPPPPEPDDITPLPEPEDTTPPPVPSPMVPADGLELACNSTQNLVWLPVEDESGIAGYYVRFDKEVSAGNWQRVNNWGPIQGKQQQVPINCGLRYRWSVRAEDKAGNISAWSSYSTFSVILD